MLFGILMMADQRSIVCVDVDISVVSDCGMMRDLGVDNSLSVVRGDNLVMGSNNGFVVDWLGVMRNNWNGMVLLGLVGCLGRVVSLNMVRVLVVRLLGVDNLMVLWESASMAIVVVHLQDKVSVFNVNLA